MLNKKHQILLSKFADASDALFEAGIITTDSFTGEIGEFIACTHFKLEKTQRVTRAVDGISRKGEKYQVKAKVVQNGNYAYHIKDLETDRFDMLAVVYLDISYNPLAIVNVPAAQISNGQIRINSISGNKFTVIPKHKINIPLQEKALINHFAELYNQLLAENIIRSRRIVGDIGEFYAAQRLGLSLSISKVQKGIDATDMSGLTFEIKTRRVYQSGRRTGEARRLNNLSEKEADYLIVVTLDRAFQCSGMWLIPMTNIINPKQANLKIVNDTPGVLNLIPSQIPWLKTGTPFEAFQIPKPKQKKEVKNRQNSKEASATYSPSKRPKVKMQINEPDRYLPKSQPSSDGLLWLILIISIVLIMMYL